MLSSHTVHCIHALPLSLTLVIYQWAHDVMRKDPSCHGHELVCQAALPVSQPISSVAACHLRILGLIKCPKPTFCPF